MRMAEFVQFRAPAGFSETIEELAEREGVSASEFMRRAILADIDEHRGKGGARSRASRRSAEASELQAA